MTLSGTRTASHDRLAMIEKWRSGLVTEEQTHELACSPAFRRFLNDRQPGKPPQGGTTNGLTTHSCVGS